jgi:hypothetical protein
MGAPKGAQERAVFYLFGHPTPYAYGANHLENLASKVALLLVDVRQLVRPHHIAVYHM